MDLPKILGDIGSVNTLSSSFIFLQDPNSLFRIKIRNKLVFNDLFFREIMPMEFLHLLIEQLISFVFASGEIALEILRDRNLQRIFAQLQINKQLIKMHKISLRRIVGNIVMMGIIIDKFLISKEILNLIILNYKCFIHTKEKLRWCKAYVLIQLKTSKVLNFLATNIIYVYHF